MAEINLKKLHKKLKRWFSYNSLEYSLADKVRIDIWARKYAPCYSTTVDATKDGSTHELSVILFSKFLEDFCRTSAFEENGFYSRFTLFLKRAEIQKAYEENRRIEELEVWRY